MTIGLQKLAGVITTAALALAGAAVPAAAHDSSGNKCVTQHEWHHAHVGIKKVRVHAIFDSPGSFWDGHADGYTRAYRPCAWNGGTDVKLYVGYSNVTSRVAEKRVV